MDNLEQPRTTYISLICLEMLMSPLLLTSTIPRLLLIHLNQEIIDCARPTCKFKDTFVLQPQIWNAIRALAFFHLLTYQSN